MPVLSLPYTNFPLLAVPSIHRLPPLPQLAKAAPAAALGKHANATRRRLPIINDVHSQAPTSSARAHVTIGGLINGVNYGFTNALIPNSSTKSALLTTLQSAQTALNAGNHTSAKSYLNTFVSQVNSAGSNKITPSFAALLVNWAQDLIARL